MGKWQRNRCFSTFIQSVYHDKTTQLKNRLGAAWHGVGAALGSMREICGPRGSPGLTGRGLQASTRVRKMAQTCPLPMQAENANTEPGLRCADSLCECQVAGSSVTPCSHEVCCHWGALGQGFMGLHGIILQLPVSLFQNSSEESVLDWCSKRCVYTHGGMH